MGTVDRYHLESVYQLSHSQELHTTIVYVSCSQAAHDHVALVKSACVSCRQASYVHDVTCIRSGGDRGVSHSPDAQQAAAADAGTL